MTTVPAYTIGGLTRPALNLDATGHILLEGAAADFAAAYGLKALYAGLPASTPWPPIPGSLSTPSDANAAANSVAEGAAVNTPVGLTVSATNSGGVAVSYSLSADSSGGGFKIDPVTGVVSVANPAKIDFESSPGHAYTVTAQASDGALTSSQTFTIGVTDVAPSVPTDSNAAANTVAEGAANGTTVGVTAASTDVNGPGVTWSLTGDTSGGGFTINATTGVISVADPTKIDYETSPAHAYTVTARASDGTLASTQTFTINVTDVAISAPVDSNAAVNTVAEGAANGSTVGITASAVDPNGPATTYSLIGDTSGGGFTINATTGVVTVADATKIDYESAAGHAYSVTVQAVNGATTTSQSFSIAVTDVAPSTPTDSNLAANTVVEGAANGSTVGVTASSTDVNGPAVTYSLTGDTSGGGFTINAATGVVTVADATKINFETASHAYTVTAQASDGTLSSSQTFTIAVTDVAPSTPVDSNAATNTIAEGAANGSTVGVTASSTDVNGPPVTYSLVGDTSGGGFTINSATGVVTVADATKIDYETAAGHAYSITAQASDGTLTNSQTFSIAVSDVAPSTPVDGNAATNTIAEGAANGSTVGVTASATDVNSPAAVVTYSLTGDTSGGGFTINATTGVVTVADSTKIDFESSGGSYAVTAQASDGTLTSSQTFTIAVSDVAPSTPTDSDAVANTVSQGAPVGTYTHLTAAATDINGPAVTWTLTGDTSGGGFGIDSTGKVIVADPSKVVYNPGDPTFTVTADASDGTLHSQQTFTITVIPNTPPVANDDSASATEKGGLNNAVAGVDPSGNVILGTGAAGAVQDTDAEDASNLLTVVAVHTGPEGGSLATGTVGSALTGAHGSLTLGSDGTYTYAVNQTDAQVQGLHTSADTLTDVFNYTIQDTGGLQDTATLTVTIHGADDLPGAVADTGTMTEDAAPAQFDVIANDSRDPDSTASNLITVGPAGITVTGPAGETFVNTDAQAAIVSNQIQVTLTNSHFQQLALGEHATVTVPYTLTGDTGETSTANLVVTVNGVNDVPLAVDDTPASITEDQVGTFTVLANDTLDVDHGAPNNVTTGTVTNLVAPSGENIDTGDVGVSVNGSNQVVVTLGSDFQHMRDGQTATFDIPYTLHGDQAGDTSTATLHVTVTGANDAPIASNFTFNGVNSATGNTDLVVNDPTDGAPDPAGPQKTISASLLSGASDVDGPGPLVVVAGTITTVHNGTVTMQADGDFTYKPAVGYIGADSFTYTVSDQNPGVAGTATATVNLNVIAPTVWYVNADAATDGDGSSENPFNTLSHFAGVGGVDHAGDTIFLETSTAHFTGGLTLENNEQLISQSNGLVVPDGGGGAGTVTLVAASGANAVVDGGVVLGTGNTIEGVDFGATAGFALSGSSVGTVHVNDVTHGVIDNASGGGVNIAGSSNVLNMDFTSISSGATTGGTNGIALTNSSGTFHAHGGTIQNSTGADVALNGGTVNFTDDGAISDTAGTVVSIANMTGGTQDFNGSITSTGGGIALSSNTGATMSFDGGMTLATGTSNAFTATGGGTLTVTGTNHLTTTTGTALDIADTTIGSGNVTFHDISANGGASGIVLDTTGSSGGLIVTGTGSTVGSGGTIQHMTGSDINTVGTGGVAVLNGTTAGTGIFLHNTSNVSLNGMQLNDFSNYGIYGNNVTGFVLNHSVVSGVSGDNISAVEGAVRFDDLHGSASVSNTSLSGALTNTMLVLEATGAALNRLTVDNVNFGAQDATGGNDALSLLLLNNVTANATIQNSHFNSARGDQFQVDVGGTATSDVVFQNNVVTNPTANTAVSGGGGLTFGGGGTGSDPTLTYLIDNNTISNVRGDAILVALQGGGVVSADGTFSGSITNNTIGVAATNGSGSSEASGIETRMAGSTGTINETIDSNHIFQFSNFGLLIQAGQHISGVDGTLNVTATNNVISNPSSAAFPIDGISVNSGTNVGDAFHVGADIHDNTVSGTGTNGAADIRVRARQDTTVDLPGYAGAGGSDTGHGGAVDSFLSGQNGGAVVTSLADVNNSPKTGHFVGTPNPLPAHSPLLAASGGVQASSPTSGETQLTQAELNSAVAAAIAQWAHAGASGAQLAALSALTVTVADLAGNTVGEQTPGHIVIDTNAAGHGWFIDPTPSNNFEFTHPANAAGTDLYTDAANAAAGHIDLLTTVAHEMGHELGLPDSTAASDVNDLMYINLVDGERRLPDAADVAQANASAAQAGVGQASAATAHASAGGPTAGSNTIDAGHSGKVLFSSAAADHFVFGPDVPASPPTPSPAHTASYSAAQGHTFDFSVLTSQFHGSGIGDAMLARAVEDASGTSATLQVNSNSLGLKAGPTWVNVAHLDGAHAGDPVNVLVDNHAAVHLAQIHVDLLV